MQGTAGTSRPGRESGRGRREVAGHNSMGEAGGWEPEEWGVGSLGETEAREWERAPRSLRTEEEEEKHPEDRP